MSETGATFIASAKLPQNGGDSGAIRYSRASGPRQQLAMSIRIGEISPLSGGILGCICSSSLPTNAQRNSLGFTSLLKPEKNPSWNPSISRPSLREPIIHMLNYRNPSKWPVKVKNGEMEGNSSVEDIKVDEQALQQELDRAIKEENYALAAKLRDNLQLLNEDNKASVLAANTRFYNAFRNGDFVAMRTIWAKGDNVCCVHPGAGAISGYDLVMGSWEIVCGSEHEFPIMIDLRNVEVHVKGDVGYVTCLEVVKTKGSSWGRQIATNVFERIDRQWFMCVHHASHVDM